MNKLEFPTSAPVRKRRLNDVGEASFLVETIWRRRRFVLGCLAAGLLAAAAFLMLAPSMYRASALLLIDFRRLAPVGDDTTGIGGRIDVSVVASQVELLRSEPVLTRAVRELNLAQDPEFTARATGLFNRAVSLLWPWAPPDDPADLEKAAARQLSRQIDVRRVAITYVIEVSTRSRDPEKAARITNGVARAYIEDQLQARYAATARANEWMQSRIIVLQQQASQAELAVLAFRARNGVVMIDGRLAEDVQLSDVTVRLGEARIALAERQARLDRVRAVSADDTASGSVGEENQVQVITQLRQRAVASRARIADYTQRFGAGHVSVVTAQRELDETRRALALEVQRIEQTLDSEVSIARAKVESLEKTRLQFANAVNAQQEVLAQMRQLEVLSASLKQLYESFLQRQMISLQEQSYPITEARLVGEAIAPTYPAFPRAGIVVPVVMLVSLMVSILLAVLMEVIRPRFLRGLDAEQALDVPFMGYVPRLKSMSVPQLFAAAPVNRASLSALLRDAPTLTWAADRPRTEFAETLRRIRLQADEIRAPDTGIVIGVTSAQPGEGKTTTSANFATFLARSGARVTLIDGDLRVASLSRALAPEGANGLEEVLSQADAVALATTDDGLLTFMPAVVTGKNVTQPDQLLRSEPFRRLIDRLRRTNDYVVIDLPPLNPVIDVRAIAPVIDAFVLIVRWNETPVQVASDALAANVAVRSKLLGCLLNGADPDRPRRDDGGGSYAMTGQYFERS